MILIMGRLYASYHSIFRFYYLSSLNLHYFSQDHPKYLASHLNHQVISEYSPYESLIKDLNILRFLQYHQRVHNDDHIPWDL